MWDSQAAHDAIVHEYLHSKSHAYNVKIEIGISRLNLQSKVLLQKVRDQKRTTKTGYKFIPWKPAVNRGRIANESKPSCIADCNRLMDTTMRVDIGPKRPISRHHHHVTTFCYMRLQK